MKSVFAVAALLTVACATSPIPRVSAEPPPGLPDARAETEYQRELAAATATYALYDGLDTRAFFRSVLQSDHFIGVRMQRFALFRGMDAAQVQTLASEEQARLAGKTEAFLGVYASDRHFEDFARPDSIWRVVLRVQGHEYSTTVIERLGSATVGMRAIYSWMDPFWVGYRLEFPKVAMPPGTSAEIELASPLGRATLRFVVK